MLCNLCGENNPDSFYPYNKSRCKDCLSTKWGTKNDKVKKAYIARYRFENKDKIKKYYKDWYANNGRKRDPIKSKAHYRVRYAIVKGWLAKPKSCSICDSHVKIEGHHNDYTKPLEVSWLCNKCHRLLHRGNRIVSLAN